MRLSFLLAVLLLASISLSAQPSDSLLFLFWNLENMFDTDARNGGEDFSPSSPRHWTKNRFMTKSRAIAKTLLWTADRFGRMPDLVGFAEVENADVVKRIVRDTQLSECGYDYLHYDSDDRRGIDVCLLYNRSSVRLLSSCKVPADIGHTRDILCVDIVPGMRVCVCHFPSKYGGEEETRGARLSVMGTLLKCLENGPFVAMGDFNDGVSSEMFELSAPKLANKALTVAGPSKGSIKHNGRWETIDMFLVSKDLDSLSRMYVLEPPFLMMRDVANSGLKPRRTYTGPRYSGGVSDHLPVCLRIKEK